MAPAMTDATPSPAQVAEALEARAAIDEAAAGKLRLSVKWHDADIAKIHERRAELDRTAAQTIRALEAARVAAVEALQPWSDEAKKRVRRDDRPNDSIGMMVWICDLRRAAATHAELEKMGGAG